jgi:hypothetical protein
MRTLEDGGPLPFAIGAAVARLLEFAWPLHLGVRFAAACGLGLTLVAFWYGSYLLARRPGLQPPDPLGAGASRTDFGRAIADSGLLVLLACLGLVARMHETTAAAAQVSLVALFLFGAAYSLEHARRGALVVACAIGASVATRGIAPAAAMAIAWLVLPLVSRPFRLVARPVYLWGMPLAVVLAAAWPIVLAFAGAAGRVHLADWLAWNGQVTVLPPRTESLSYVARTAPWFYWPVWPLAAWAVWRWRSKLDLPAIALPLVAIAALAIPALFAADADEAELLTLAPPMAMLAAVGLPTLKRGIVSLIDWFAVTTWTLLGIAAWGYWIAFNTGWPPRMAYRASMLAPEFAPDWIAVELVLGVLATFAWLMLVRWRVSRQRPVIWRAVVLSAGGLVFTWFLLMTLWLPAFNARNTYRDVATDLVAYLGDGAACVETRNLGRAERASFAYFAEPRFGRTGEDCALRLIQDDGPVAYAEPERIQGWELVWTGKRRDRIDERFRLYRRQATKAPAKRTPAAR